MMNAQTRRFEAIGYLHVSGEISIQEIPVLKSWLDSAENLKLTLILDLSAATMDQTTAATLKPLLKCTVITNDTNLGSATGIMQALSIINTPEAKAVEQLLTQEGKLRQLKNQQAKEDALLTQMLASFGKDATALDTMKPEDFVKLNHQMTGKQDLLLKVYSESIHDLKIMDSALSQKKAATVDSLKVLADVKAEVLGFLTQKGVS